MASTRNINNRDNYKIEQRNFDLINNYTFYENSASGKSNNTVLPGLGLNGANIPRDELSHNPVNIESYLFGINSTNLVKPHVYEKPRYKSLRTLNISNKPLLIMPDPLVVEKNQRPLRN
jgi:hypothetical protein|tara:strand:+ start:2313 stop:2669 length:357 start_codon:yes stop_codon:yes gene_type:complete